ncbi:sulfate transporter subunit [Sorangium cellulosum]|uniref:Sulfate transporter subunit n=1 Tax=Sorangium cellulosum TaxID=56 RepID=A0A2L0FA82_SORCE|nr:sulfate ABC transporter substrate-binding protein [Sorangium cellulosum]AUX48498.1 sulfate transporter subunit [Sorangium cellulosum]
MTKRTPLRTTLALASAALLLISAGCEEKKTTTAAPEGSAPGQVTKLAVASYDPTRELYQELNPAFERWYKQTTGKDVDVETDHGPSGKQARDIAAGKETDVAALSVDFDVDTIAKAGLLPASWRERLPNGSVPYTSAVIFLVRAGNPKQVKGWEDLARPEVVSLCPDPKTGGGARWIYLSTWAHAVRKAKAEGKTDAEAEAAAREFTTKVYDDALLDPAMRGSSTRFIAQRTGDVLFGWENEILQIANDPSTTGQFEVVVPSDSITIEVPLAVVDKVAERHGVKEIAEAYVKFHFSDEGQELIARRYNRPYSEAIAKKHAEKLRPLTLFRFKDHFSDWPTVMNVHFGQGAELDKMRKK